MAQIHPHRLKAATDVSTLQPSPVNNLCIQVLHSNDKLPIAQLFYAGYSAEIA